MFPMIKNGALDGGALSAALKLVEKTLNTPLPELVSSSGITLLHVFFVVLRNRGP